MGYLTLSGDEAADLAMISEAYAGRIGKHPHQQGKIALAATDTRNKT